jgi:ABC-type taurine transport system substrate-binding protein
MFHIELRAYKIINCNGAELEDIKKNLKVRTYLTAEAFRTGNTLTSGATSKSLMM